VVIGHSHNGALLLNRFVFSFDIPIFFIISGFLFAENNSVKLSAGNIAYRNFRRLLLPYIATALIVFFIVMTFVVISLNKNNSAFYDYISSLKYAVKYLLLTYGYASGVKVTQLSLEIKPAGITWFLPSLFCADLIFYYFLRLSKNRSVIFQSIVVILLTGAGYLAGKYIFLPWSLDISLVSQVFLFSGYLMQRYKVFENKTSVWLIIAIAGIWVLDIFMGAIDLNTRRYNHLAVSLGGAIGASYLLMKLSHYLSGSASMYLRPVSYIGRRSLFILCFQLFDKINYFTMLEHFSAYLYNNNHWVLLTGLRLCISLCMAEIMKFIPPLKFIYWPKISRMNN